MDETSFTKIRILLRNNVQTCETKIHYEKVQHVWIWKECMLKNLEYYTTKNNIPNFRPKMWKNEKFESMEIQSIMTKSLLIKLRYIIKKSMRINVTCIIKKTFKICKSEILIYQSPS